MMHSEGMHFSNPNLLDGMHQDGAEHRMKQSQDKLLPIIQ